MSIPVSCAACQYQFAVPADFAGKRGKCPKCGAIIVAPAPEPKPAPPVRAKSPAPTPAPLAAPIPAPLPAPRPAPAVRANPAIPAPVAVGENPFSFATTTPAGQIAATAAASVATRRPVKKQNNTGMFIALGAGGGILALAIIAGGIFALSGGDKPGKSDVVSTKGNQHDQSRGPRRGDDDDVGLLDRPRGPINVVAAKPREAESLEEVVSGIVKIETMGFGGKSLGTGFIINEKGWIATNYHVVEDATDQTRAVINNQNYKLAGLVIKSPEHDMAIIKLAEQPFQLTVLNISYDGHPKLASKVRAVGYPDDTFNLTEGIVSNVTTTSGLNDRQRAFVLQAMQGANNHLWIQHDAKISPGNSGGPLLNEENQVVGINTWVSSNIDVGYAGHISHLRDLVAQANDTVTPFPKGVGVEIAAADEMINTVPTAARINQLIAYCSKFEWKPTTLDQFDAMAELAKLITMVRFAQGSGVPQDIKQATDQAVQLLGQLRFSDDEAQRMNTFAADATNKPLHGIVCIATMVEPNARFGDKFSADRMVIEGNNRPVIVKGRSNQSLGLKDARLLIVGLNSPTMVTETDESGAQRLIVPGFTKELK